MKKLPLLLLPAASVVLALLPARLQAETKEVRAAQQYGLSYLALMLMENDHLVEAKAKEMGLGDIKCTWAKLGGPGAMNDALLSGGLDFGTGGVPSLITLWSKTHKTPLNVKSIGALNSMPNILCTNNAAVKTVQDFTDKDKIAVTTVKVSTQALLLQMAAAQAFGQDKYQQLDSFTVSMSHPDSMAALLGGKSEITAHFASPPYQSRELATPGIHAVIDSYDILGGPATFNVVWCTSKFRDENPKTYAAFLAAYKEATERINKDKRAAAELYLKMSNSKESLDEIIQIISDPRTEFTLTPLQTMKTATFMQKVGRIPEAPASWKDLFFPELHALPGS
ncbi:MAG: ABC transporter substrate-binding protein [Verrucomicrobia bacterium]|nr:ABC transporter substrate-binding protein [Verrucomicrobiota bacterium]